MIYSIPITTYRVDSPFRCSHYHLFVVSALPQKPWYIFHVERWRVKSTKNSIHMRCTFWKQHANFRCRRRFPMQSNIIHKCAKKKCGIEWMQNSTLYTSVDREMGKSNNVHLYNSSFIHSISVVVSLCSNQFGVLWHSEWFPCPLAWVNYRSSAHDSHRNIIIDTPMVVVVVAQVETVEHDDCVDTFDSANHSAMTIMSSHMHMPHCHSSRNKSTNRT